MFHEMIQFTQRKAKQKKRRGGEKLTQIVIIYDA